MTENPMPSTRPDKDPIMDLSMVGPVLIVENDAANVLVISTWLELAGCPYTAVHSGEEAIEAVKQFQYAAILMDIQLNGMDGIETAKHIRALQQQSVIAPVRIIAVTGRSCLEINRLSQGAGIDEYLSKPFTFEHLARKLYVKPQ